MESISIRIEGMSCGHCERSVRKILEQINGIEDSRVFLEENRAEITFDPDVLSKEQIMEEFNKNGIYKAL